MRIDNAGESPIRIPADVRLLEFEIEAADVKNPKRKKKTVCKAPPALAPNDFPESRALVLAPGQSYVEEFDPRLFCFGKAAAALTGGAVVRTKFGWKPAPSWSKKPPEPPFAAQGLDYPSTASPLRMLAAPPVVLSYGPAASPPAETESPDQSGASAKAPTRDVVDENAPRLELDAQDYADAPNLRSLSITATAKNTGHRPMLVALRPRMLSFEVGGPGGTFVCEQGGGTHAMPADAFRTLKPGASSTLTVLLAEVCPREAFKRSGLYRITPTLHANETGEAHRLTAYTTTVTATEPTLVRLQFAPDSYYEDSPKAITLEPTPADEASSAD